MSVKAPKSGRPAVTAGKPRAGASPPSGAARAVTWHVNWPLLAASVLLIVLLVPAAYFWHSYQVARNGKVLLDRAAALEKDQRWADALNYVQRYLRLFPEDVDARVRLAEVFDHIADESPTKIPAAERLYSVAVGLAPERHDLRLRHAERLTELGRFSTALEEANQALRLQPDNVAGLRLRAIAANGDARSRGDFSAGSQLVDNYRAAIKASAGTAEQVDLAVKLAYLLRLDLKTPAAEERAKLADEVIDEMVATNPERASARTARYAYRQRFLGAADDTDIVRALELDQDESDLATRLAAAERAKKQNDFAAASKFYEQALAIEPGHIGVTLGLAELYAAQSDHRQAIDVLNRGLAAVGMNDQRLPLELTLVREYLAADELHEADRLLATIDKRLDVLEHRAGGKNMNQFRSMVGTLRAGWHMARQEYSLAAGLLKRTLADKGTLADAREAAARAQAFQQLGRCYSALHHWDQAALAFKEAAALVPQDIRPQIAVAQAWQSAGRLEESVREFRQAVQRPDATVDTWAALIEVQLRQQVAANASQQDWSAVQESLSAAQQRFPDSAALAALAIELNDLRDGANQTLEFLVGLQAKNPASIPVTERLMLAYQMAGQVDQADELLRQFESAHPDPTDLLLLRVTLLGSRAQFEEAYKLLSEHLAEIPEARRPQGQVQLAVLAVRLGRMEQARGLLTDLIADHRQNELLVELVATLALEQRDFGGLEHWEDVLRELEGPDGSGWRFYRVQRLLSAAEDPNDPRLKQAEQLAGEVQQLRPLWPKSYLLQGQVAARRGQAEQAIVAYRRALELGDRRPIVSESLVSLLYATNDLAAAEKQLDELGDSVTQSPRLASIAIAIKNRRGDSASAVELARRQVAERPQDPLSHIMLGQALRKGRNVRAAGASFLKATELAPADLRTWQALFGFQLEQGDRDAAAQTLANLQSSVKIGEREMLLIVAQDQVLLGDADAAAKTFQQALAVAPKDISVLRRVAAFFNDRDPALAERCLRQAREQDERSAEIRWELAEFLIARGGEQQLSEAAGLIEPLLSATPPDAMAHSLQARLLLRRATGDDRERAKQILEDLVTRNQASNQDVLNLITIHESEGRVRKVQELAFYLVNRNDPRPDDLARYVDLLLRDNRSTEAIPWLQKLVQLAPDDFRTFSLRVRWLAAEKKSQNIEPLVEKFLAKRQAAVRGEADLQKLQAAIAQLYAQVKLDQPAERALRELAGQSAEGYAPLALWLAQHERTAEAVDLCLQAVTTDASAQAPTVLAKCLTFGSAGEELAARAEPILSAAHERLQNDAEFLFSLANWRLIQGRTTEAVPLLRRALELEPRHPLVMNNLAFALAEQAETRAEARTLIDRALSVGGSLPDLLSTKGTICLLDGDVTGAVRLFQDATSRSVPDPRYLLNLAQALKQAGKRSEAKETLRYAESQSLDAAVLSPQQKQMLSQLRQDLNG